MAVDVKMWVGINYRSELHSLFVAAVRAQRQVLPRINETVRRLSELDPDQHEVEILDGVRRLQADVAEIRSRDGTLRQRLKRLGTALSALVDGLDRYYHRINAFYIEQLAEEFGISTWEEIDDNAWSNGYYDYPEEEAKVLREAIREWDIDGTEVDEMDPDTWGLTEARMAELQGRIEAAEENARLEAENQEYQNWKRCVEQAIEPVFEEHELELTELKGHPDGTVHLVEPKESWAKAAEAIRQIINGIGMFAFEDLESFLDSGPYTPRQAVLTHLHWLRRAHEVYGGTSPSRAYDNCRR